MLVGGSDLSIVGVAIGLFVDAVPAIGAEAFLGGSGPYRPSRDPSTQ